MSKAKMFLIVFCVTVFLLALTCADFGYFHHTNDEYLRMLLIIFSALNAILFLQSNKLKLPLLYLQRRNLY